jgi:hypothetical protein
MRTSAARLSKHGAATRASAATRRRSSRMIPASSIDVGRSVGPLLDMPITLRDVRGEPGGRPRLQAGDRWSTKREMRPCHSGSPALRRTSRTEPAVDRYKPPIQKCQSWDQAQAFERPPPALLMLLEKSKPAHPAGPCRCLKSVDEASTRRLVERHRKRFVFGAIGAADLADAA